MLKFKQYFLGAASLVTSVAALAAPYQFNFGAGQPIGVDLAPAAKMVFTSGDLTVSINASTVDFNKPVLANVTGTSDGLGVKREGILNFLDPGEMNGLGTADKHAPGDHLMLRFNKKVTLSSLVLNGWGEADDAYIFNLDPACTSLGGVSCRGFKLSDLANKPTAPYSPNTEFDLLKYPLFLASDTFMLQSCGPTSSFRLNGLTATAPVPEASTYLMMALGLVGVAAVRRKAIRVA